VDFVCELLDKSGAFLYIFGTKLHRFPTATYASPPGPAPLEVT